MLDANGLPIEEGTPAPEEAAAEEDARLKAEAEAAKAARAEEDARVEAEAKALEERRAAEDAQPHDPLQLEALKAARAAEDAKIKADAEALAKTREEEDARAEPVVVLPGNCDGELEMLPDVEGTTYHMYKCKVCGQLVHVGLEHLELYGLPPQHHKLEEEAKK
jgi:hypothetical protein